ncbi:MAG TPA: HlyD family efflux transporter periplasmic adaptor subunit [Terrimicrobiaceae bacterium]|nr:HlyD family efflux transporter periplasmic adaptor subunit [Terrimicrobiaceae bacterium]
MNPQNPRSPSPARRRSAWRRLALYALGAAIATFIVTGLIPKPIPVDVTSVTRGTLTVSVLEEGKTRIRHRHVVSPPVSGFLRRVPVRAGDPVVAGETILATIQAASSSFLDPRARAQAEAAVQSAEAARQQRNEQVSSAASELELARKELARAEKLKAKGAIAIQAYDAAENRVDMLDNQFGSAKFALKVAEFELAQAQAALVQAGGEGGGGGAPVEIRSPVTGYVLNVYEENARVVTAGLPIMEVGDPADLEAEIELLSSDAVNVRPGADVSIEQWGGGEPLHGTVALVEPGAFLKVSALGVEEQRVKVRVNFSQLPGNVLGDRYRVEARIVTWSGRDILQIPTGAIFRRGNDWMTFVVTDGRARLRKVEIGHSNGVAAEVVSGVSAGERVVLHPPDTVADGTAIRERAAE